MLFICTWDADWGLQSDAVTNSRRLQAHDLPIVSLIDCPGFMVGAESEADATVRKFSKMFIVGGSITTCNDIDIILTSF